MASDSIQGVDGARIGASTAAHDGQHWCCDTQLTKVTIPDSLLVDMARGLDGLPGDLRELHRLSARTTFGWPTVDLDGYGPGELQRTLLIESGVQPELVDVHGNLLMYGGASVQWETLIGNGTSTAGNVLTYFSAANAAIGVGDSTTAAVATQTDLQATTNKLRVAMDATYPQHTDGVASGSASCVFRSTFSTAQANWAWQEWAVFNSSTAGTGRALQRKVESLGTKTSSATWTLAVTLSLS